MLPNGDTNSRNIDDESTVKSHTHSTYDIVNFQSALDAAISNVRGLVPEEGNTLGKLYDYIISGSRQIVVPDIPARDSLDIFSLSTHVFVVDTGDGWGLFKPLQIGTNVEYVKLSDANMLNSKYEVDVLTSLLLPQGDIANANQLVMGNDTRLSDSRTALPHEHKVSDIPDIGQLIESTINDSLAQLPTGVIVVPDLQSRNTLTVNSLPTYVFVIDAGEGWGLFKPLQVGVNVEYEKISDATKLTQLLGIEVLTDTMLPDSNIATADQLVMGNDARLSDSRPALPHTHAVHNVVGIEGMVETLINNTISQIPLGVTSVNDRRGEIKLDKFDVGLDKVDNTSDIDKPISKRVLQALNTKINIAALPSSITSGDNEIVLGVDPRLRDSRTPLPHKHTVDDVSGISSYVRSVVTDVLNVYDSGVQTVNGKYGIVTITKSDINLQNVDNTSDEDKPISTQQAEALATKIDVSMLPDTVEGKLVLSSDPRLSDARKPLPHMTESIVDFIDSTITVSKVAVKRMISKTNDFTISEEDDLSLSVIPDLEPGFYTRVLVSGTGRVTQGSNPSTISELGVQDVYNKTQVDNLFNNISNVLDSNKANKFVKLNEQGRIPDLLVNSNLHFYPRFSRFPVDGNTEHLYIDKETNTVYRFDTDYIKLTPDVVVPPPVETLNKQEFAQVAFSGSYADLKYVPTYSNVAKSGDFKDLKNTPVYAPVASSGSFNDLVDRPTFADIAWSGSYLDLHNRPEFAEVAVTGSYNSLRDLPDFSKFVTADTNTAYKTKTLNFIGKLAPRTGKARWYPEADATILYAYASTNSRADSNIVCQICHNLRPVNDSQFNIDVGEFKSEQKQLNFNMKSIDFLTVDILEAVGEDLSVTIVYR